MEAKQTINQHETLCFVAGKSGGHLIPCLTLAQQYRAKNKNTRILFFANNTSLDKKILKDQTLVTYQITVPLSSFSPKNIYSYPRTIIDFIFSFIISFYYLFNYKPTKLISTGGIVAFPVCLAALLLRIPLILFELNATPGKSIKFLTRFAHTIWYCFDEAKSYFPKNKREKKNYPIRFLPSSVLSTKNAKNKLLLSPEKRTITILGGSQGSLFINNLIKQWLLKNPQLHAMVQLIHQTGIYDKNNWEQFYQTLGVSALVFSYQPDPVLCYSASDLILCRAGAGTLFEICFFGRQCITIPLETTTTSHQINNAYAMSKKYPHYFQVLEQKKIDKNPEQLFALLNEFYEKQNL